MSNVLDFGLYKFCSFCEKWDGSFLKLLFIPVADKNVYTSMLDTWNGSTVPFDCHIVYISTWSRAPFIHGLCNLQVFK